MKRVIYSLLALLLLSTLNLTVPTPVMATVIASTAINISASDTEVAPGSTIELYISETNNGKASPLHDVYIELFKDGVLIDQLTRLSPSYTGGDIEYDRYLNEGETWTWTYVVTVNADTRYTVIGHGICRYVDITYPDYPDEMDEVFVTVVHQPARIGDFVWNDLNRNGVQDAGETGISGVTVNLHMCSDNSLVGTTTTDSAGIYGFTVAPGSYYVEFVKPAGYLFSPMNQGSDATKDSNADLTTGKTVCVTLASGQTDLTWDAGMYRLGPPRINLIKFADAVSVAPGVSVTYFYTAKNTGDVTLTDVTIRDNNGTPGYPADDFVVGTIPSLAPGAEMTLQVMKFPPQCLCVNINGTSYDNLLIIETVPDQNGDGINDIKVTYRQSRGIVDNVYGTPANDPASGWYPKHHNFSDFTGSDEANFRFTDALGNVVLDFKADYISASKAYLSGYGTLGVGGGDGGMIVGSAANVLSVNTTITTDLNQSPAFYGYTVDSPTPESTFSSWDYVDGYTIVVNGAIFEDNGFGNATVYSVHNSPPKIGTNQALPKPCDWDVTNTAYVTAKAGDTTLTATASTTVKVIGGTISPPGPYTTYKQDQWGGDKKQPSVKLLNEKFSIVYPTGVTIGDTFKLSFTSASAVLAFLPQSGAPNVLKASATNPTKSDAGELAGQVLALQLNTDFSNAGITRTGLAALHLKSGKLATKSVADVLKLANQVLGGNKALLPAGVSPNDLKDIVKKINENYESGTHDRGYLQ